MCTVLYIFFDLINFNNITILFIYIWGEVSITSLYYLYIFEGANLIYIYYFNQKKKGGDALNFKPMKFLWVATLPTNWCSSFGHWYVCTNSFYIIRKWLSRRYVVTRWPGYSSRPRISWISRSFFHSTMFRYSWESVCNSSRYSSISWTSQDVQTNSGWVWLVEWPYDWVIRPIGWVLTYQGVVYPFPFFYVRYAPNQLA